MEAGRTSASAPLADRLDQALGRALRGDESPLDELADVEPFDERDALTTLLALHALDLAPVDTLNGREWFQHHPAIAALRGRLESAFIADLDAASRAVFRDAWNDAWDVVAAVRRIAAHNLVPPVYDWLADEATYDELVDFLAVEGGPDGGFDDLVAIAQVGLAGEAKLTLAANYWDEMGRGDLAEVHTELHHRLSRAVELPRLAPDELPVAALRRSALNGVLAGNRAFQPEMIGALGVLELQAGPRCRRVLAALDRLDAPVDAAPFYAEHASTDPRHGKEWLDAALVPLADAHPDWAPRFVRGAAWRCVVNDALFDHWATTLVGVRT